MSVSSFRELLGETVTENPGFKSRVRELREVLVLRSAASSDKLWQSTMCKGQDPADFSRKSPTETPLRRRAAEADADLAVARERLAESVEALRQERARAAELFRRLEESLAERERLRKVVAVMDVVRAHLIEARLRGIRDLLQRTAARDQVV